MTEDWNHFLRRLCNRLRLVSKSIGASAPYGVYDADEGIWCKDCAPDEAWCLNSSGFFNEDHQCFCDGCGKILDHFFTDWGLQEEIEYSLKDTGPIPAGEAFSLLNCIDTGNPLLTGICGDYEYMPELRPAIRHIAKRLKMRAPKEMKVAA